MLEDILSLKNTDGSETKITIYQKEENKEAPVVIICPAMGVRGSFYEKLAKDMAESDLIGVVTDLRGVGQSSIRPKKGVDFGYKEMLDYDYTTIFDKIKERFPDNKKYFLGHSLGGQLAALFAARNSEGIDGLIMVACCSVYYKGWTGFAKYQTLIFTQAFSRLANFLGYFPGHKVGFGGKGAKTVLLDWSRQARTGDYVVKGDDFDYEKGLSEVEVPILAISFARDNLAPKGAVEHLLSKFKDQGQKKYVYLDENYPFDHYKWAKKTDKVIELIKNWL